MAWHEQIIRTGTQVSVGIVSGAFYLKSSSDNIAPCDNPNQFTINIYNW